MRMLHPANPNSRRPNYCIAIVPELKWPLFGNRREPERARGYQYGLDAVPGPLTRGAGRADAMS